MKNSEVEISIYTYTPSIPEIMTGNESFDLEGENVKLKSFFFFITVCKIQVKGTSETKKKNVYFSGYKNKSFFLIHDLLVYGPFSIYDTVCTKQNIRDAETALTLKLYVK